MCATPTGKHALMPLMDGTRTDKEIAELTGYSVGYIRTLSQRTKLPLKSRKAAGPVVRPGIPCPACGGVCSIRETRPDLLGDIVTIRRVRHCLTCGQRQTTFKISAPVIEALEQRLADLDAIRRALAQPPAPNLDRPRP